MPNKITVQAAIAKDRATVWACYTQPSHITRWNFALDSWHCPRAENELRIGGKYLARMEAKDGSFGFDFAAVYTALDLEKSFSYIFGGREATVTFDDLGQETLVTVTFDPEDQNSPELQQQGWQAILNNFKKYVEHEVTGV